MGSEIFTVNSRKYPDQEAPNSIDKFGKTLDFMLSGHRDEAAATAFFTRVIGNKGFPDRVVIDKSGANLAGLQNMNCVLI
jgi:putative transposase